MALVEILVTSCSDKYVKILASLKLQEAIAIPRKRHRTCTAAVIASQTSLIKHI